MRDRHTPAGYPVKAAAAQRWPQASLDGARMEYAIRRGEGGFFAPHPCHAASSGGSGAEPPF
jgi:hypothetical protein